MLICPLCNSLYQVYLKCPVCEETLVDTGILENYFEPYSPYLGEELLDRVDGVGPGKCIHLFSCPQCGYDKRYVVKAVVSRD